MSRFASQLFPPYTCLTAQQPSEAVVATSSAPSPRVYDFNFDLSSGWRVSRAQLNQFGYIAVLFIENPNGCESRTRFDRGKLHFIDSEAPSAARGLSEPRKLELAQQLDKLLRD